MATFVRTQTIEHPIGQSGRLSLKVTSADVQVRGAEGDIARVRATFDIRAGSEEEASRIFEQVMLRVSGESDSLVIEEPSEESLMGGILGRLFGGHGQLDLEVEIDMPAAAELRLEGVSSDMQASGLHGEQRYTTVSGDIYLTDMGGQVRLNSVSGDVTLRGSRPLGLRVSTVSGDVSAMAPRLESLRANAVSGDVEVEGELAGGGEFAVETVSGDLRVGLLGSASFEVRGISSDVSSELEHRVEGRLDRRRVVIGEGGPDFRFSSMSGDLSIGRPRRMERMPQPPSAPAAPAPPSAPAAPRPEPEEEMAILQALERGEIDVDEATRRLSGGRTDG